MFPGTTNAMKEHPIDRKQLFKFFAGRATILEQAEIDEWLKEGENYEKFFDALNEWETSNPQYQPSLKTGYQEFQKKIELINEENEDSSPISRSTWNQSRLWIMIACVLLIFVTGYLVRDRLLYRTVATNFAETHTVVLYEDSKIVLNANSSVKIPRFIQWYRDREVWLNGEAFFRIQKSSDQAKFVVHTDHLDVEVLGTSFNVNSRRQKTKVVLEEGSVRVLSPRDTGTALALLSESGDYVESDGQRSDVVVGQVDHSLFTAWQDRKLKFDDVLLTEVLQTIDEFYGVIIQCTDTSIMDRSFTGTLPNDNLDIVLRSLSNIYETSFQPVQSTIKDKK